jgi:hypothetical protein
MSVGTLADRISKWRDAKNLPADADTATKLRELAESLALVALSDTATTEALTWAQLAALYAQDAKRP